MGDSAGAEEGPDSRDSPTSSQGRSAITEPCSASGISSICWPQPLGLALLRLEVRVRPPPGEPGGRALREAKPGSQGGNSAPALGEVAVRVRVCGDSVVRFLPMSRWGTGSEQDAVSVGNAPAESPTDRSPLTHHQPRGRGGRACPAPPAYSAGLTAPESAPRRKAEAKKLRSHPTGCSASRGRLLCAKA